MVIMRAYYKCICSDGTRTDFTKGCPVHDPAMKIADMGRNYDALDQRVKELEACKEEATKRVIEHAKEARTLRAENERLQARLTEQADEFAKLIQSLKLDVAERDGEIEGLKHWHQTADLRAAEIVRLREVLKAVADIGFTGEDAVDARDIAKKALGGGE